MASAPLHIAVKSRREIFLMDLLLPMSSASLLPALEASENMRNANARCGAFVEEVLQKQNDRLNVVGLYNSGGRVRPEPDNFVKRG
jgi:hypothetical protein